MTNTTAQAIRTDALAYNADYAEAADEIATGTPVVDVSLAYADANGRKIRAVITRGLYARDGGFIASEDPRVVDIRRFDGRLNRTQIAERSTRALGLVGVEAPVMFREVGL